MNNSSIISIQEIRPKKTKEVIDTTSHKAIRNTYINWFFKRKEDYVILRQFKNEKETKIYITLPIKERNIVSSTLDLFDKSKLNNNDFPFDISNIVKYETIYTGHIEQFFNFPRYLSVFRFTRKLPGISKWAEEQKILLYKDYTKSKLEQEHDFTLVSSFTNPTMSINSIFRLLQTKYVTLVAVTFTNNNNNKDDKDLI